MRELEEIRRELDETDRTLVRLFEQRMALCREVARTKMATGKAVLDRSREEQVLDSRAAMLQDPALAPAVRRLYELLMTLSREEQTRMMEEADRHA